MGEETDLMGNADAFIVSEWAVPVFRWACGSGARNGTADRRLAPREGTTRAQLAALLHRLQEQHD